jgi:hypothetical protein
MLSLHSLLLVWMFLSLQVLAELDNFTSQCDKFFFKLLNIFFFLHHLNLHDLLCSLCLFKLGLQCNYFIFMFSFSLTKFYFMILFLFNLRIVFYFIGIFCLVTFNIQIREFNFKMSYFFTIKETIHTSF